jgi:diacylglycerol O-acyltransferase
LCLTDGVGLGHTVQSPTATRRRSPSLPDRELLPDPDFYVKCIEDSFAELLAATQQAQAAPTAEEAPAKRKRAAGKAKRA